MSSLAAILCMARAAFPQPAFKVATIKPLDTFHVIDNAGIIVYPGGRLVIHALSLKAMIAAAYDAGLWQLSGGEDWMRRDLYDVDARPAATSGSYNLRHTRDRIGDERLRQMLQALLAERFQLKVHRETKTGAVYLLERSTKKLLLRSTTYTEDEPALGAASVVERMRGHWGLFDVSASQLAKFASDQVLKPVIDKTGLEGSFDYREGADIVFLGDLGRDFTVFIQDVGLKLKSSRGPVETFVIEHAEKPRAN